MTCTRASGSAFAVGATTVTRSATDAAGKTGSAELTVAVRGGGTGKKIPVTTAESIVTDARRIMAAQRWARRVAGTERTDGRPPAAGSSAFLSGV